MSLLNYTIFFNTIILIIIILVVGESISVVEWLFGHVNHIFLK